MGQVMVHPIFIAVMVVFIVAMWLVGLSAISIGIASALPFVGAALFAWSDQFVERVTGRSSANPTETSKAVNLCVTLLIGMPPIFLLPDAHPFVLVTFQIAGMAVGGIVAQLFFGRRRDAEGI